jgi:hypothetical protein
MQNRFRLTLVSMLGRRSLLGRQSLLPPVLCGGGGMADGIAGGIADSIEEVRAGLGEAMSKAAHQRVLTPESIRS